MCITVQGFLYRRARNFSFIELGMCGSGGGGAVIPASQSLANYVCNIPKLRICAKHMVQGRAKNVCMTNLGGVHGELGMCA